MIELTGIINQVDLTGIYRTFHQNRDYTFFSAASGIFSIIDHILDTKQISTDIRQ